MNNLGLICALLTHLIWGLVPLFWRELSHVDSAEIVAHRMVWSCLMALGLVVLIGQWRPFRALLRKPKLLLRLFISSILISINWGVYIWSVNNGYVVEASMGYYINPLINVLFGVLFFHERLRRNQFLALTIAGLGVAYLILSYGRIPYIALGLALTFACYGAVKKAVQVPATHGMAVETGLLIVPATIYLVYLQNLGQGAFGVGVGTSLLLIFGGLITLVPLVLFAFAAQRISMTTLGMTQYLGPTLQLLLGVWVFKEPFPFELKVAFVCIWAALFIYTFDQIHHGRRRRRLSAQTIS